MRAFDGTRANAGMLRFNSRGSSTSQPTATATAVNICTAVLAYPIDGRTYRVSLTGDAQNGTAGALTTLVVRHGIGAITGGTEAGRWFMDHRVAGRTEGFAYWTEFTYSGTSGISNYNVVLIFTGTGGTSTIRGDLMSTQLVVDEIL